MKIKILSIVCAILFGLTSIPSAQETMKSSKTDFSSKSFEDRVKQLEDAIAKDEDMDNWFDRITISGVIEGEAGSASTDYNDSAREDVDESDVVLATVELGIDAEVHKHVSGHILLLYEEDENDGNIAIDEGFITIDGKDVVPLYLNVGQLYVPFGQYESHMITDPVTLDLGETSQSAVQVGFANDLLDASVAIFNGDVDEPDSDSTIGSIAAGIVFTLPEDTIANVGLSAGVSYISNIADTDGFEGFLATSDSVEDHVAGMGAFVSVSVMDMVFIEAEYISAIEEFKAADLDFAGGDELAPSALNIELAFAPIDNLMLAIRYSQTDDFKGGVVEEVLPETQYGICASYGVFDNTSLSLEYLKSDYENDDEVSVITAQLGIEF